MNDRHPHVAAHARIVGSLPAMLLAAAALLLFATPSPAAQTPAQIIEDSTTRLFDALRTRADEFNADEEALHDFLRDELGDILDTRYTGRLVLGRHARDAADADVAAFAEALQENLLRRYGTALLTVDPTIAVRVVSARPVRGGQLTRVATEIRRPSGAPIPVDYLFREREGRWQVFDVVVEGVSYVQTFRSQFDPLIRESGIAHITRELRAGRIEVDPDA